MARPGQPAGLSPATTLVLPPLRHIALAKVGVRLDDDDPDCDSSVVSPVGIAGQGSDLVAQSLRFSMWRATVSSRSSSTPKVRGSFSARIDRIAAQTRHRGLGTSSIATSDPGRRSRAPPAATSASERPCVSGLGAKPARDDIPRGSQLRMLEIPLARSSQLIHSRLRIAKRRSSVHSPFDHVLSTRCPSRRIPTASSSLAEAALRVSHEAVTRCLPS